MCRNPQGGCSFIYLTFGSLEHMAVLVTWMSAQNQHATETPADHLNALDTLAVETTLSNIFLSPLSVGVCSERKGAACAEWSRKWCLHSV